MARTAAKRTDPEVALAILVYREDQLWFARSVMTSDLGFGKTGQEALSALDDTLEASLALAKSNGLTAREWLDAQTPDEPRWIERWSKHWNPQAPSRSVRLPGSASTEIEARIAWSEAV